MELSTYETGVEYKNSKRRVVLNADFHRISNFFTVAALLLKRNFGKDFLFINAIFRRQVVKSQNHRPATLFAI